MIYSKSVTTMIFVSFFLLTGFTGTNKKLTEDYVSVYKSIAISEMKRTGIPASIKLAQGLLESDLGRSELAFKANNHFGIKCGSAWDGKVFYKFDDDKDTEGKLMESCFRSFENSIDSYIAHSEFLNNPAKQSRYGFLFDLGSTDYVGWANGLKFSGYATDPNYADKLIKIIESNQLYKFDTPTDFPKKVSKDVAVNENKDKKSKSNASTQAELENSKSFNKYKVDKINDVKMVIASGGESLKSLALKMSKDVFDLLEYNEKISSQDDLLAKNEIVFLDKKKKSNHENELGFHTVKKGESMYSISQSFGVRLESLLSKNNLHKDAIPLEGEVISLSKNLSKNDTPKHKFVEKFDSFVDLGGLK
jgi:LysM repeat protein